MVTPRSGTENSWVGQPHNYLKGLAEYKMDFADRVHRFFFNGGALTVPALTNRYRALADSVEASSRALPNHTQEKMWELIQYMISVAARDGQFSDCDLTLSELDRIAFSFLDTLHSINHGRVAYPDLKGAHQGGSRNNPVVA